MASLEPLNIDTTKNTPKVTCNPVSGKIVISGICIPENGTEFFLEIRNWIEEYIQEPAEHTEFIVDLEYFNTTTSIFLLNLFKLFNKAKEDGHSVKMVWRYDEDDPDMKEAGEEYNFMVGNCIEFVKNPIS